MDIYYQDGIPRGCGDAGFWAQPNMPAGCLLSIAHLGQLVGSVYASPNSRDAITLLSEESIGSQVNFD